MPVGSSPSERARALRRQREQEEERRRREAAQRAREALRRRQQAAAAKAAPKRAAPDRGTVSDRGAADRAIRAGAQRAATREVQQVGFKEASRRAVARSEAVHAKGQRSVVQWTALVKKARARGVNPIYAGEYDRLERHYGPDVKVDERSGRPIDPLPDLQRRARRAGVDPRYAVEFARLSRENDLVQIRNGRPVAPPSSTRASRATADFIKDSQLYRTIVLGEQPPSGKGWFEVGGRPDPRLRETSTMGGVGERIGTSALARDVRDFSAGLLPGAIQAGVHPGRAVKQGFAQYEHTYGPALRGDLGTTWERIREHPLGPGLDVAAVLTGGVTAGARVAAGTRALAARQGAMAAAREVFGRKVTPFRYLQTPESLAAGSPGVQLRSSRNPIVRVGERYRDRRALERDLKLDAMRATGEEPSRAARHMEFFGSRARAGRARYDVSETRTGREMGRLEPLNIARRRLNRAEETAYDVIGDYGDEAARAIHLEIQMRQDRLLADAALAREGSPPKVSRAEHRAQVNQIALLKEALESVQSPSPQLQKVLELGRKLSAETEATKVAIGALTPEGAAEHLAQPYRIVTGATSRPRPGEQLPLEEAPRPIRVETIERPRTVADLEARRNELQGIYDEVMAKAEAQYFGAEGKLNKAERAEQARRNRSNAKIRRQMEGLKKRYVTAKRKDELDFELSNNPPAHRVAEIKRDLKRGYEEVTGGGARGTRGIAPLQPNVKDERRAELVKIFEETLERAAGRGDEAAAQFIRVQDELHDLTRRLTPEFMEEPDLSGLDPVVVEQRPIFAPEQTPPLVEHFPDVRRITTTDEPGLFAGNVDEAASQGGEVIAYHLTGDPNGLADYLRGGGDLSAGRPDKHGDMGSNGLYVSARPEAWRNRVDNGEGTVVPIGLRGTFAELDVPPFGRPDALQMVAALKDAGVDGAYVRAGMNGPGQLVVWNRAAVTRVGEQVVGAVDRPVAQAGEVLEQLRAAPPAPRGAFYRPRTQADAPRSVFSVATGLGKPRKLIKPSRQILFTQGRFRRGPKLTLENAARTIRYQSRLVDFEELMPFSKELDFDAYADGQQPGFRYFNPEGARLPREWRDSDEIASLTPQEIIAQLQDMDEALLDQVFPRVLPEEGRNRVRQIPEVFARGFEQRTLKLAPNSGFDKAAMRVIDDVNAITKLGTIYLKPTYIPFNVAGNLAFLAIQQGLWTPLNLLKAWHRTGGLKMLGELDLETLRRLDYEVGTGGTMALAGDPTGTAPSRVAQRVAEFESNIADRMPRRAAILHELARRGYKTRDQIAKLLDEPNADLWAAGRDAEEAMVRFRGMSPAERHRVARFIFVYPWLKGATRYAGRLVLDHPIKADLLAHLGQQGTEEMERVLGKLQGYLKAKSLVPVGGKGSRLGIETQKVLDLTGVSPTTTATEIGSDLMAFAGMTGDPRPPVPASLFTPLMAAGTDAVTRFDAFRGRPYPEDMNVLEIGARSLSGSQPLLRLLAPWEEGSLTNQPPEITSLDPNPTRQPNWLPGGPLEPLLRFGLGGFHRRELNLTAQHAKAGEDESGLHGAARGHAREVAQLVAHARTAGMLRSGQPLPRRVVADLNIEREVLLRREAELKELRESQPGRRGFPESERWRNLQLWVDVVAEQRPYLAPELQQVVGLHRDGTMTYDSARNYIRRQAMPDYTQFNAEATAQLKYLGKVDE